jgi:hypothetical protein
MARGKTIQTTVGDLIVALTEEIEPYAQDEKEISILVSYLLADLCRTRPRFILRNGHESTASSLLAHGSLEDGLSS